MFLSEEKVEELKKKYPKGTRVRLFNMEGETSIPPGTKGTVKFVDDAGQIHVSWENKKRLALNVQVDSFEIVSPMEELREKLNRQFLEKLSPILEKIDYKKLHQSCNSEDTSYAADTLLQLHLAFEAVYGQGYVNEDYELVAVPAVLRGFQTKINTLAIIVLNLNSSGEHYGTTYFSPEGLLISGNPFLTKEQKQLIADNYGFYDYWYTPLVENDIHIGFENMPEQVVKIRAKVDELFAQRAEAAMEASEGGQVLLE